MTRPNIAYTTSAQRLKLLAALTHFAIWMSGGRPVRVHANSPGRGTRISGVVITGGTDVFPEHFGTPPKQPYIYDHPRDRFEMHWLRHAETYNLPVLGICRGAQLINIARGGSLHMDVEKAYEKAKYPSGTLANIFYRKKMRIVPESLLARLIGRKECKVNSMHTQSMDRLGQGLVCSGLEANGVVQAAEDPEKDFFLAVQFHPEALIHLRAFRSIFKGLVEAAREQMPVIFTYE